MFKRTGLLKRISVYALAALILVVVILLIVVASRQSQLDNQNSSSSLPSIVQTCKDYLYTKDHAKKDLIDYSIYQITDLTYEGYLEANFFTKSKINEKNIGNYIQVIIGDTQVGEMGEHNYAVLLVEESSGTVCGYAPVK